MAGSTPYLLKKSANFERSFKKLAKSYKSNHQKQEFIKIIGNYLEEIIINPYPPQSRNEPLPSGFKLPEDCGFYKLVIVITKGSSGQIRLMYLVDENKKILYLYGFIIINNSLNVPLIEILNMLLKKFLQMARNQNLAKILALFSKP